MKKVKIAIIGLSGQSIFMNVDKFHEKGETKQSTSLYIEPGGKGYNQAVACARLGAEVYYLSAVGKDQYGIYCEQVMQKEGINALFIKKQENTALATIITDKEGNNQVTVFKGANECLNLSDLELFKPMIDNSDILLIQNEIPFDVLKEAIIYAYNNKKYVIYNPAPAVYDVKELLPFINMIIPNEAEAYHIFKKEIDKIENDINIPMIITLGSKGCLYLDNNTKKYYNAKKVKAVDTTGAGDVFCAAIACKINTCTIEEAIKFAIEVSSLHVQRKYVIEAIPYINEIKK